MTQPEASADLNHITLTVEKLVCGGDGLGRTPEGQVFMVPYTAPGDTISGHKIRQGRRETLASQKVTVPSDKRQTPPCPHAYDATQPDVTPEACCGSCDWMHLPNGVQQHWKQQVVEESLVRLGKIASPRVLPLVAGNDAGMAYRHTVTWSIASTSDGPRLGYRATQTHNVIPFNTCRVLAEPLQQLANRLNAMPEVLLISQWVKARTNQQGDTLVAFCVSDALWEVKSHEIQPALEDVFSSGGVGWRVVGDAGNILAKGGEDTLNDTFQNRKFTASVQHFMQGNPAVMHAMLDWLQQHLQNELSSANTLLDMYCGVGVFGLSLLQPEQDLIGIENNTDAIAMAQRNADLQGVAECCEWYAEPVESIAKRELLSSDAVVVLGPDDIIICDPPRTGLGKGVVAWVCGLKASTLVYVSCNPATLARDTALLNAEGWKLTLVQPFDMFPQTHHVETIALLHRS